VKLPVLLVPDCPADCLVQLGERLLSRAAGGVPVLLMARLREDAVLLGRYQRCLSALNVREAGALLIARRAGGGRAIFARAGTLAVHLALPSPSFLLQVPIRADLLLNRYVRGLNAGLREAGAFRGVFYLGRDAVVSMSCRLAVISQDGLPRSSALFEAVIGVEHGLELPRHIQGYPPHSDPRAGGPPWISLSQLWDRPRSFEELSKALAAGYARMHGCELVADPAGAAGLAGGPRR
jgi:hypothetical protein